MYFLLRYYKEETQLVGPFFTKGALEFYKEETQLVGPFFTKGALEFMVKILDQYTHKSF